MKTLLVALLLLTASPAFAADKWTLVESKNFTLVGNAAEKNIRDVATTLEQFREVVTRLFPRAVSKSSIPTNVIVFRDDPSFKPFKPIYQGKPTNVAGYFQSGPDVNFIALTADHETPRVIYHEYVHLLSTDGAAQLPAWFNEGIAEYYSTFLMTGGDKKVQIGRAVQEHLGQLSTKSLVPLETLFTVSRDSASYNEADKQGTFYAESWAVVHELLLGANGKHAAQFAPFLNMLADGRPVVESFEAAFQMKLADFQKELDLYVRNRVTYPFVEYTLRDRLSYESEMQSHALTDAEVQFYLGDLLLHSGRIADAETYLKKAIELNPQLAPAQASMGMLRLRQDNYPDALAFLKRASEAGTANYLVHYYYAESLERQRGQSQLQADEDQLQTMRSELKKSVDLSPEFVPALEMLGYVNLLRREDLDESETVLRTALKISPGRDSLVMMLSQVLVQRGKLDEARPLLERMASSTSASVAMRASARDLITYVDRTKNSTGFSEIPQQPPVDSTPVDKPLLTRNTDEPAPAAPRGVLENLTPGPKPIQGETVTGLLTLIDCSSGMTLTVKPATGAAVRLHTATPEKINFVSYTAAVSNSIMCGPVAGSGTPVRVIYRADPSGSTLGEPLEVAFIDKN